MPKTKDISLSEMIDSASEDDANTSHDNIMPTPDSSLENIAPRKKGRQNSAGYQKTIAKAVVPSRPAKSTGGSEVKRKGPAKKAALREQTNGRHASDTEGLEALEEDEMDITDMPEPAVTQVATKPPSKRGRPPKAKPSERGTGTARGNKLSNLSSVQEQSPGPSEQIHRQPRTKKVDKSKPTKRQASSEPGQRKITVVETQKDALVHDDGSLSILDEEMDVEEQTSRPTARQTSRARSISKTRQTSLPRKRGASTSDTERANGGGDPAVRRKLGEMTRKFQNLDLKYRNLREVGVKDAEINFDKLRKQAEERMDGKSPLHEIATQTALAQDSRSLQKQLSNKDAELSKLQSKISQMTSSLSEARNETKVLSAKLSANRVNTVSTNSSDLTRAPASAVKPSSRTAVGHSADAAQASVTAQLKEDLYSDLTGLILRSVKKGEEADVYDCIQTGRNGTLHFKLSIAHSGSPSTNKDKTSTSATSYEEAEVTFTPLLDASRDSALIEIMPEYLTEEITFARDVAAKFYARVVDCLTKAP
ncbi:MAG: hypothetical protein M1837_005247 [Sclerophora amabilis]|nr:MAG: hypothetical protein M1837_005247 [Sclerophora amabilis]